MTFESHDERRECVRYACDFAVKILDQEGKSYLSESCDLSEKGICLLIRAEQAEQFMNTGCPLDIGDSVKITITDVEGLQQRSIVCSVSHSARMPGSQYIVGLFFEDGRDETRDYILQLLSVYR